MLAHDTLHDTRTQQNLAQRLMTKLTSLAYRSDVLAGPHAIAMDTDQNVIHVDEITTRNILHRIDPLFVDATATSVTVQAADVVAAIDNRDRPIHHPTPNRIAGAPRRDGQAIAKLRKLAVYTIESSREEFPTMVLWVPASVAGWSRLRKSDAERALSQMF